MVLKVKKDLFRRLGCTLKVENYRRAIQNSFCLQQGPGSGEFSLKLETCVEKRVGLRHAPPLKSRLLRPLGGIWLLKRFGFHVRTVFFAGALKQSFCLKQICSNWWEEACCSVDLGLFLVLTHQSGVRENSRFTQMLLGLHTHYPLHCLIFQLLCLQNRLAKTQDSSNVFLFRCVGSVSQPQSYKTYIF